MRGQANPQPEFVTLLSPESVVPPDHPLRAIKRRVDDVLRQLHPLFERMYAEEGRPSIPPERLLKAKLLIALYSVRSETLFCEQLQYNLLFRWFLDLNLTDAVWDNSSFTTNQERLIATLPRKSSSARSPTWRARAAGSPTRTSRWTARSSKPGPASKVSRPKAAR